MTINTKLKGAVDIARKNGAALICNLVKLADFPKERPEGDGIMEPERARWRQSGRPYSYFAGTQCNYGAIEE